jgi:hypothetical protein
LNTVFTAPIAIIASLRWTHVHFFALSRFTLSLRLVHRNWLFIVFLQLYILGEQWHLYAILH